MNIQTDRQIKIFCKTGTYGNMYSTGISQKQEDGTYLNAYLPVQFKKDTEPNKETNIYIKKAWLKPTKDNKIKIFISEYELVEDVAHKELSQTDVIKKALDEEEDFNPDDWEDVSNDLPF